MATEHTQGPIGTVLKIKLRDIIRAAHFSAHIPVLRQTEKPPLVHNVLNIVLHTIVQAVVRAHIGLPGTSEYNGTAISPDCSQRQSSRRFLRSSTNLAKPFGTCCNVFPTLISFPNT